MHTVQRVGINDEFNAERIIDRVFGELLYPLCWRIADLPVASSNKRRVPPQGVS
jgi:hypothetical protein